MSVLYAAGSDTEAGRNTEVRELSQVNLLCLFICLLRIPSLIHQIPTVVTDPAGVLHKCVIHSAANTAKHNAHAIILLDGERGWREENSYERLGVMCLRNFDIT